MIKTINIITRHILLGTTLSFLMMSCSATVQYLPLINDPLITDNNRDTHFSILSYNIQSVFGKDETKLNALIDYLNQYQYDFVLLQELFDEDARNYIIDHIDGSYYKSLITRIDYQSFPELLFQDAGLFLLSSYPQVDLSAINFDPRVQVSDGAVHMVLNKELSLSTDFLANKSIMGSLHRLNETTHVFVFTTHLQALGSKRHKRQQLRQIQDFIEYSVYAVLRSDLVASSDDLIVVLTGDFNSDGYDPQDQKILITELGHPRDLHLEAHPRKKEYTMSFRLFNMHKRFDYIFAYDRIGEIPLKKINIHSINATDIKNRKAVSLSDHLALKASLTFEQEVEAQLGYRQKGRQAK